MVPQYPNNFNMKLTDIANSQALTDAYEITEKKNVKKKKDSIFAKLFKKLKAKK